MTSRTIKEIRIPPWLFLVSFLLAVAQVRLMFPLKFGPQFERAAVARALAHRGEFADPFSILPTGPTTHVSPIYPMAVAGILRILGETSSAALFLTVSCVLMHALYPVFLFLFARHLFSDHAVPMAAAVTAIAIPHFPPMIHVETIYLVNALLVSFVLTWRWLDSEPPFDHHAIFEGILAGLCTLLNAAAIVIWFTWIGYLYWRKQVRGRQLYAACAILTASFLAVMSPWVLRNYCTFGTPILLRGNLGFELALSNRDGAAASTMGNGRNGILAQFHPNFSIEEAEILKNEGEVEYNRRKWNEARQWIIRHPARFLALTMERIRFFWFPPWGDGPSVYIVSLWVLTVLAIAGLIKLWLDNNPFVFLALAIYIIYPALLYFIQSSIVYTLPIVWLHVICAGYLIASIPMFRRWLGRLPAFS